MAKKKSEVRYFPAVCASIQEPREEVDANEYLKALLCQYPLEELPGTICMGCNSDDVNISRGTWTCEACGDRGTIQIVVKRLHTKK